MNANLKRLFLIISLVGFFVFRSKLDFPFTYNEVKESYTAYSIINTFKDTNGRFPLIFFPSDGDYLSTLGVFLKIPTILIFGLDRPYNRILPVLVGLFSVYVFYLIVKKLFKDDFFAHFSVLIFSISPSLVFVNIFDIDLSLIVLLILLLLYLHLAKAGQRYIYLLFGALILTSFYSIPFILLFLLIKGRTGRKVFLAGLLFLVILISLNSVLRNFLVRQSLVREILPDNYTFMIDKKLSFGKAMSSPLIAKNFNFNRITHNKAYYFTDYLFRTFVSPFDFEYLASSFQSQTILSSEYLNSKVLPKLFFWEIPVVFLGLLIAMKKKMTAILIFFYASLASLIFFGTKVIEILVPFFTILEIVFMIHLVSGIKKKFRIYLLFAVFILFTISSFSFLNVLRNRQEIWFNQTDLAQYKIWNFVTEDTLKSNKFMVTDRVGNAPYYYLFYENVKPDYFLKNAQRVILDPVFERVVKIGDISFGSFKYLESPRSANEIWIGMEGEFIGRSNSYDQTKGISDGEVLYVIDDIKTEDKFIGNKLLIVKTKL